MTAASSSRYVHSPVLRAEDPRLLRGGGRYLEDVTPVGALHVAVLRSPHAHARILDIRTEEAARLNGVVAVFTGADLGAANQTIPIIWRAPGMRLPPYLPLAVERVHHVGVPVAAVVARDRYTAEDALDLIAVDYEPLPPVVDARAALEPDAPVLYPEWGDNEMYRLSIQKGDADAVFAAADVVVESDLDIQRYTAVPMERRGVTASYDAATGMLTVWATIQHPHAFRSHLAPVLGVPESRLRVIAPDVGGAFGVYYEIYPEDVIVACLAMRLRHPVTWVEDRREAFLTTIHARQQHHRAALALDREGRVLALRDRFVSDLGAYSSYSGIGPSYTTANYLTGCYDIQTVDIQLRCAVTNKVRSGGYRGFGQPQGMFVIERLMDLAAERLGLDPAEIRRRNLIQPDQFPYQLACGAVMDSGNYPGLLAKALEAIDYEGFRERQRAARAEGRRLGLGLACYMEMTGTGPSKNLASRGYMAGGWEVVTLRVESDGSITAFSGVSNIGQGIRTALSQLAADELGVEPARVEVITGDTALVPRGNRGSIGSRSAVVAGQAMQMAAHALREKAVRLAAHLLEAGESDIEVEEGRFFVRGVPGRALDYRALGEAALFFNNVPEGFADAGLEATATYDPPALAFASGIHAATVEIDRATGSVQIDRYVVVHDCGRVINPMIVEGQVLGATAQGIGGALLEELVYDESGQILTTSLMDYLLPTAVEVPPIDVLHQETPSPLQSNGAKGAGEGGTLGPPAALANAVADALRPHGNRITATPITPERIWNILQSADDEGF